MTHTFPEPRQKQLERLQRWALGVGAVAALVCIIGFFANPSAFFHTYLVAYLFFLSIAHGCFAILMVYFLTGGAWGFLIRNILEAGMRTLPLLAILFVPIALGVGFLFAWADPETVSQELQHKQVYLNVPFFLVRAALYFAIWLAVAYFLGTWSAAQERTGDAVFARMLTKLSGPGLVLYGVTIFFASIDWIMSLQPAFRSTIIGPLFASGELLVGLACALVVMAWLVARPPLDQVVSVEAVGDLGSLLFTFLVIWAYMTFFQFMLVWIANLPYDVMWYVPRASAGWQWAAWALFIFHFAVPFFLLLLRAVKRNPRFLAALAGLLLFMHLIYLNYQILPAFPDASFGELWLTFVAPVGVGGLWLAYFLRDLRRHAALPSHDANQQAAIYFHLLDRQQQIRAEEAGHG